MEKDRQRALSEHHTTGLRESFRIIKPDLVHRPHACFRDSDLIATHYTCLYAWVPVNTDYLKLINAVALRTRGRASIMIIIVVITLKALYLDLYSPDCIYRGSVT